MRNLWPRGARPYRRAMLVEAQVSSMEHKAFRVEIELSLEPVLAPLHDVRSILLAGVRGLFLRVFL